MNVSVNGSTLNVTNAYAERDTVSGIITCFIYVPYSETEYGDLKALFKGNTEDIVYTNDNDNVEIFSGFSYLNMVDDDANEQYIVKLTADEYAFQLGRNRQLETDKTNLENTVASKDTEISNLNVAISEKDKSIAEKDEAIVTKDAVIAEKEIIITEQTATIEAQTITIAELEQTVASKDEKITALAEQCADLIYVSALEELQNVDVNESEVI